jgi:Ca2+/Na+ antiporter
MAKNEIFDSKNIITSLKGIGVSIVTSVCVCLIFFLGVFLLKSNIKFLGIVVYLLGFVSYLFFWGYFAKRFWNWR